MTLPPAGRAGRVQTESMRWIVLPTTAHGGSRTMERRQVNRDGTGRRAQAGLAGPHHRWRRATLETRAAGFARGRSGSDRTAQKMRRTAPGYRAGATTP